MTRPQALTQEAIATALRELPGWKLADDALEKRFEFEDFSRAFAFMQRVAEHAEELDHHPDWRNVYSKVEMRLTTHDVGALTELDLELARLSEEAARDLAR